MLISIAYDSIQFFIVHFSIFFLFFQDFKKIERF